jgi:integrase
MVNLIPPRLGVFWGRFLGRTGSEIALTDVAMRQAKQGAKPIKLADGSGMFLLVTPAGGNLESARRTLQLASMVFRFAVATARLRSDPTRDLRGALTAPTVTHYGAITEPKRVGELLRAIDGYEGQGLTKLALQLAPHVYVRPGELRHAEWSEVDLDGALWTIPAAKMKMRKAHAVPLSRQAVELFREVQTASGPAGDVFPSIRTR